MKVTTSVVNAELAQSNMHHASSGERADAAETSSAWGDDMACDARAYKLIKQQRPQRVCATTVALHKVEMTYLTGAGLTAFFSVSIALSAASVLSSTVSSAASVVCSVDS